LKDYAAFSRWKDATQPKAPVSDVAILQPPPDPQFNHRNDLSAVHVAPMSQALDGKKKGSKKKGKGKAHAPAGDSEDDEPVAGLSDARPITALKQPVAAPATKSLDEVVFMAADNRLADFLGGSDDDDDGAGTPAHRSRDAGRRQIASFAKRTVSSSESDESDRIASKGEQPVVVKKGSPAATAPESVSGLPSRVISVHVSSAVASANASALSQPPNVTTGGAGDDFLPPSVNASSSFFDEGDEGEDDDGPSSPRLSSTLHRGVVTASLASVQGSVAPGVSEAALSTARSERDNSHKAPPAMTVSGIKSTTFDTDFLAPPASSTFFDDDDNDDSAPLPAILQPTKSFDSAAIKDKALPVPSAGVSAAVLAAIAAAAQLAQVSGDVAVRTRAEETNVAFSQVDDSVLRREDIGKRKKKKKEK
jgi:hypothetical protein